MSSPHDDRPRRPGPTTRIKVEDHDGTQSRRREDRVATEEPLEIRLATPGIAARRVWVTMRTPGHDFELAAGYLVNEGLVARDAVERVAYCRDEDLAPEQDFNVVTVTARVASQPIPDRHHSLTAGSSACGVCGKDSIKDALSITAGSRWRGSLPSIDVVRGLAKALRAHQSLFDRTGGVHGAALATAEGELLVTREDVGRHNAVDKVIGAQVLAGESTSVATLVVSGRAGFELVQKAVSAGVGSMVAGGAPTSLAVRLATDAGLALFGWTKAERTVRYC